MHLKSFLKQVQEVPVALGLHFFIGDKAQGRTVNAVAHAIGGLRIAGEHMAEVGVSGAASDLRAAHPVAQILFSTTAGPSMGFVKAGQPQLLSYLSVEEKSGSPVTTST